MHEPGYRAAHENKLGEVSRSDCRALLQGDEDYARDGQFKHASSGVLYETYPPDQTKALWDQFKFVYLPKRSSV